MKIYIVKDNNNKVLRSRNKNVFISLSHIKSSSLWKLIKNKQAFIEEYDLSKIVPTIYD